MIKCVNLTKKYNTKVAVDNLSLDIGTGLIYGFLGTNGAGKTTTIKMLTGQLPITSGEAEIAGMNVMRNPVEVKRQIGIVPDEPKIYPFFTGNEFIQFILDLFKMNNSVTRKDFNELCEAFDIDFLNVPISDMSHGMRQKLMVTSVLMRKPRIIFLDEPTVGLDARSSRIIKDLLKKRAHEGATIFLTTHVLEIAEKMCDRIGILHNGVLLTEGTMEELREKRNMDDSTSLEDLFLALTDQAEDVQNIVNAL
ncbi:MAG TPA: ABC transporter ATP-binding protein [Thermotogota bacterium]|nr:ABC transporter ATP-binding protein [Thermotogota bacterium]HPJ89706.1 ABC transporter ATP-binding protein [Thermotogota bacterium]HPR97572.1 ABC transporter ATP-binding protein [Thermotogota bacterium]